ncbi:hypothetical protein INQ30_27510, partial [Escherichia coli]|nr:hypothetical protein [Escherichia coli]
GDLDKERAVLDARKRQLAIAEDKTAQLKASLADERKEMVAEARVKVDDALNAIAIGIEALTDGRIVAVEPCAESGELLLIHDASLDDA